MEFSACRVRIVSWSRARTHTEGLHARLANRGFYSFLQFFTVFYAFLELKNSIRLCSVHRAGLSPIPALTADAARGTLPNRCGLLDAVPEPLRSRGYRSRTVAVSWIPFPNRGGLVDAVLEPLRSRRSAAANRLHKTRILRLVPYLSSRTVWGRGSGEGLGEGKGMGVCGCEVGGWVGGW